MSDTDTVTAAETRAQRSELLRFDDRSLSKVPEYKYEKLPSKEKRIRLLQLMSGTTHGAEIFCELVEADFDKVFHIPTRTERKGPVNLTAQTQAAEKPMAANPASTSQTIETQAAAEQSTGNRVTEKGKERELSKEEKEDEERKKLRQHFRDVTAKQIDYEALSWCWGDEPPDYAVQIMKNGRTYKKRIQRELALALKYLRLSNKVRTLWIDAICIDQGNHEERNHQVQMMSRVYTRAKEVCIWLGEDTDESTLAIDFIHQEIMELKNFDRICSDKRYAEKWRALMTLMQREWFSRRWVVQEIALATEAQLYCGPKSIPWKEFAVAVELFVEVETASHRLSEIMQREEKFRHIPNWFEHVSELGASQLVQATGKVFRAHGTPTQGGSGTLPPAERRAGDDRGDEGPDDEPREPDDDDDDDDDEEVEPGKPDGGGGGGGDDRRLLDVKTIDPKDRRSLLSLEYLVSTMFIFKAGEPRDVVYALLAIARDAAPFAKMSAFRGRDESRLTLSLLDAFLEEKPFIVDYERPYADVCRDFVEFCIRRKNKLDPVQALDILCRPWALEKQVGKSIRLAYKHSGEEETEEPLTDKKAKRVWQKRRVESLADGPKEDESKEDSKVWKLNVYGELWDPDSRSLEEYWDEMEKTVKEGWAKKRKVYFPGRKEEGKKKTGKKRKRTTGGSAERRDKTSEHESIHEREDKLLNLPSWVSRASKAPFTLYHHPGQIYKTGRAAADLLVGHSQDGHRNYSAAQTRPVNLKELEFRRRPQLGHYSFYVAGFELDEVEDTRDASQGGNIPKAWLDLAGWNPPYASEPPDPFWRTLVADRGRDNRNPPYYYARACKESVLKGGVASGRVNTTALIDNERNSIVAEFCRRVQAVVWGRSLFKTKGGRLGLATDVRIGDKVCILYGCTVPVILRMHKKADGDRDKERLEDQVEKLKALVRKCETNVERKKLYGPMKQTYTQEEWGKMMTAKRIAEEKLAEDARKAKETAGKSPDDPRGGSQTPTLLEINKKQAAEEDPRRWCEFIGESYVHGMMDGEALREKFYTETADRVFELR